MLTRNKTGNNRMPMTCRAWIVLLLCALPARLAGAQGLQNQPVLNYTLLEGSELVVECPICALAPITFPLRGTAGLKAIEFTPGFALYAVTNVAFTTGGASTQDYNLTGSGTYQAPGAPSFGQEMFLNLQVQHGTSQSECFFTNPVSTVTVKMPMIQINLDQTNATATTLYHLKLLAAPVVQLVGIAADPSTAGVRLDWLSNGLPVQVERASTITGPFVSLGSQTSAQSWVDAGALTNHSPLFYRLRWSGP